MMQKTISHLERLQLSRPPDDPHRHATAAAAALPASPVPASTMSRKASLGATAVSNPSDDICPVCKSNRYLNPNLEFLINPECYHRMCSSCVDRLFTSGPAPCPVAGCHRTLRKRGFRKAFFGDLGVEREVDIRRRVGQVFNRRQDEFETLRDYNNYLEEVELLVYDLVHGSKDDKKAAEDKLDAYRKGFQSEIEQNRRRDDEEAEISRRLQAAERDATRQRRLAVAEAEAEEKRELHAHRHAALDRLASAAPTGRGAAAAMAQLPATTTATARRSAAGGGGVLGSGAGGDGLTIRGLKRKEAPVAEKPYDAFGDVHLATTRYVLQDGYESEWLAAAKKEPRHMVGGYSMREYYARAMFDAFAGLGVFVADEVEQERHAAGEGPLAKVETSADDVF